MSVVGVAQDDDGVMVTLADTGAGRERLVRADYLIGADGIRSTVRDRWGSGSSHPAPSASDWAS